MSLPLHTRRGAEEIPLQTVASVEGHLRKQHSGVNPDRLGDKPPSWDPRAGEGIAKGELLKKLETK